MKVFILNHSKTWTVFNNTFSPPRPLGALRSNTVCQLFGWGSVNNNPRRDAVIVFDSQICDPNFPTLFCTMFATGTESTCSANLGSPVICSEEDNAIDGILINEQSCKEQNGRFLLSFISIGHLSDWISCVIEGYQPCDYLGTTLATTSTTALPGESTTQSGMVFKVTFALKLAAVLFSIFVNKLHLH